jgi:hypothetical protein
VHSISKETQYFSVIKTSWVKLFKEIGPEKHRKPIIESAIVIAY